MSEQEKNLQKKRGRPAIGRGVQMNVMFRPDIAEAVDRFCRDQGGGRVSRPEAVRLLVSDGLKSSGHLRVEEE